MISHFSAFLLKANQEACRNMLIFSFNDIMNKKAILLAATALGAGALWYAIEQQPAKPIQISTLMPQATNDAYPAPTRPSIGPLHDNVQILQPPSVIIAPPTVPGPSFHLQPVQPSAPRI